MTNIVPRLSCLLFLIFASVSLLPSYCGPCIASDQMVKESSTAQNARKPFINDLLLVYQGGVHRQPWTADELLSQVRFVEPKSGKEQWLFDGFLFIEYKDGLGHQYAPNYNQEPARKTQWSWLLDKNFQKGYGIPALEDACSQVASRIGMPQNPRKVIITLPTPIIGLTDWGEVNGKALDFKKRDDRIRACEWHIENAIDRWHALAPKHIELSGFYWVAESISDDREFFQAVAQAIHSRGLHFYWIPYWRLQPSDWKQYGFDAAWIQPNHFFHPNVPDTRLGTACTYARQHDMGLEMEFDDRMIDDRKLFGPRFHSYLDAYERCQAAGPISIAYYGGGSTVLRLNSSSESEVRASYERLCRFVIERQARANR